MSRSIHKLRIAMNHDASGKHVLAESSEANQNKLCKAAAAGHDTRTTHSLTRSLAVVCGQDRTPPMQPAELYMCSFEIDEE
jgi:hypothetical protein